MIWMKDDSSYDDDKDKWRSLAISQQIELHVNFIQNGNACVCKHMVYIVLFQLWLDFEIGLNQETAQMKAQAVFGMIKIIL